MVSASADAKSPSGCPADASFDDLLAKGSLIDPDISARPSKYYEAMRRQHPIHFDEKLGMYLISRWDDINTVQRDPITFSVERGYQAQYAKGYIDEFKEILERDGGGFFPDAIMSDPPYHTRIRRLMDKALTAHRVKQLEPAIREIIAGVIDGIADRGKADAVKDFSVPVTIRVICEQLGLTDYAFDDIQRWSLAVTAQIGRMQDREQMRENAKDICELQNFLIKEVRARESEPRDDMISDLVHAELDDPEHPKLTFKEVVSLIRALLIAGNETTATAMTNLIYILATQPHVLKILQASVDDDRLLNRFVEELLRIEPPVRGLSRMTTKEIEVGGVTLPEGAHLLLMYASANDDPDQFECPREFNLERSNIGRHLAFGGGPHKCIGLSLARMEIRLAAQEVVRRLKDIQLAISPDDIQYLPTVATHSIAALPFTFSRHTG